MSFIVPIFEYRQRCYCCREDKRGIIDPLTDLSVCLWFLLKMEHKWLTLLHLFSHFNRTSCTTYDVMQRDCFIIDEVKQLEIHNQFENLFFFSLSLLNRHDWSLMLFLPYCQVVSSQHSSCQTREVVISAMMAMMMNFLLPTVTATPLSLLNASSSTQTESETSSTLMTTTSTTLVNDSVSLDLPSIITPSFNESEESKAIQHVIPGTSSSSSLVSSSLTISSPFFKNALIDLMKTSTPSSLYSSIGKEIVVNEDHYRHPSLLSQKNSDSLFSNSLRSNLTAFFMNSSSSMSVTTSVRPSFFQDDQDHEDVQNDFIDDVLGIFGGTSYPKEINDDASDFIAGSTIEALGLSLPTLIIMLFTIIGNGLVILAIFTYRPLKNVQNMYLVSLAVADIAVATFVMPFNVIYTLRNRWDFGLVTCKIWLTCDILCCTASILNLCAIALDRYQAIHDPINYAQKRTLRRVLVGVALVWVISALISIPPLLGWNDWPDEFTPTTPCTLTSERGFVIYSASGSFFIPLIIMSIVYVKIYIATRRRLRSRAKSAATKMTNFNSTINTTVVPETSDPDHHETQFGVDSSVKEKRSKSLVSFTNKLGKRRKKKNVINSNNILVQNNNHHGNQVMTVVRTEPPTTISVTSGSKTTSGSCSSEGKRVVKSSPKNCPEEQPSTSSSSGDHHLHGPGYNESVQQQTAKKGPSFMSKKKNKSASNSSHRNEGMISRVRIAIEKNSTSVSGVCSEPSSSSSSSNSIPTSKLGDNKKKKKESRDAAVNDPLMSSKDVKTTTTSSRRTSEPSATSQSSQQQHVVDIGDSSLMSEGSHHSKKFSTSSITDQEQLLQNNAHGERNPRVICDSDDDLLDQHRLSPQEHYHRKRNKIKAKNQSQNSEEQHQDSHDEERDFDEDDYENEDDFDVEVSGRDQPIRKSNTTEGMTSKTTASKNKTSSMSRCNSSPHRLSVPSCVRLSVRKSSHEDTSKTESKLKSRLMSREKEVSEIESSCGPSSSIQVSTGSTSVLTQVSVYWFRKHPFEQRCKCNVISGMGGEAAHFLVQRTKGRSSLRNRHGSFCPVLATLLLHVRHSAIHWTRNGKMAGESHHVVGIYQFGSQPHHIHHLQSGLQESLSKDSVLRSEMMSSSSWSSKLRFQLDNGTLAFKVSQGYYFVTFCVYPSSHLDQQSWPAITVGSFSRIEFFYSAKKVWKIAWNLYDHIRKRRKNINHAVNRNVMACMLLSGRWLLSASWVFSQSRLTDSLIFTM